MAFLRFRTASPSVPTINETLLDGLSSAQIDGNFKSLNDSKPENNGTGASGTWAISISGNAATATTLQTSRTINGTSFNGSANITTANWGTSRTLTIGLSSKSVNGSNNVSYSLGEMGAAATNQTMHIGTTAVAINRSSGSLTLTSVSIDGNAATATALQNARSIGGVSFNGTANINLPGVNIAGNQNTTGTASGVVNSVTGTNSAELVRGNMADNDQFRILVGGTASNAGYAEIATADDGTEPIYVRQYTGVFTNIARTATLLDGSGNTSFPGYISVGNRASTNGSKILAGTYDGGGHIATLGGNLSGGGPVLGYGVWPSTSATNSFVSSTPANGLTRGAYIIEGQAHTWFAGGSQTVAVDSAVSMSAVMRIDSSGNLGIGTTSPAAKLEIEGSHTTTTLRLHAENGVNADANLCLWASEPSVSYEGSGIGSNVNGHPAIGRIDSNAGQAYIRFTPSELLFYTGSGDAQLRGRFNSSGNFIIANTSPVLIIQDTDNTGASQTGWLSFQDNTATEKAWVGYGSAGNTDLNIQNIQGLVTIQGSEALHASNFTSYTPKNFGTVEVRGVNADNSTCTTAQFIAWLTNIGAFNQTASVMKASWAYATNNDISDTGFGTLETAGCVIETFCSGGPGGDVIIRVTSPSTGEGAGGIHEYVDHGSSYSPGWRRVYTSQLNGNITGNAATATTLQTSRTINGTSFNGSANITTANWGTSRTLTIGLSSKSVNGSNNVSYSLGEMGAAATNQTMHIGTTAVAINRPSGSLTLTSVSIDGNAATATTLQTSRTINGTSFNGSANITTANWGTTRTLTIGSTAKSVNGSDNVSWTITEVIPTSTNFQINSLGVGTTASTTAGEIRATNNITAYYSDERLKTRLGNIENALDKVCSLSGFYHEANELAESLGYSRIREVGVSAQEVQAVLPEVVVPAPIDDKYLTVRYERIVPLLIEAIKELKSEIDEIKKVMK